MFKSLKAVAVAVSLFVAVPSTYAAWDYFSVIEEGSAEAKVSLGTDDDVDFKVRFGIIDNLEIMAAMGSPYGMNSDFSIGARYQVLPEMLAVGVDFGIPTRDGGRADIGLAPSVQFHYGINDMISLGAGVGLGIDINRINGTNAAGTEFETEAYMNLEFGLEVDFQLTENFGLWVGADFAMDLTYDDSEPAHVYNGPTYGNDGDMVILPGFGIFYSAGNITVGADFGIDLYRTNRENSLKPATEHGEDIGLNASVFFAVKF